MDFIDAQTWAFIEIGLIANIVSIVLAFVFTVFRAGSLADGELQQVMQFSKMRSWYINKYNSSFKTYFVFLMNLIPMYSAVLNTWYLINMFLIPGGKGIITATIKSDRLALISLVRYDIVELRDK